MNENNPIGGENNQNTIPTDVNAQPTQPVAPAPTPEVTNIQEPAPVVEAPAPAVAPTPEVAPAPVIETPAPAVAPTPEVASAPVVEAPVPAVAPTPEVAPAPVVEAPAPAVAPTPEVAPAPVVEAPASAVAPTPESTVTFASEPISSTSTEPSMVSSNVAYGKVKEETTKTDNGKYTLPGEANQNNVLATGGDKKTNEKKGSKAPIFIVSVVLILIILFLVYYFIIMTPKNVYDKIMNDIFDTFENVLKTTDESNKEVEISTIGLSGKASISSDEIKALDGIGVTYDLNIDTSQDKTKAKIEIDRNSEALADILVYLINGDLILDPNVQNTLIKLDPKQYNLESVTNLNVGKQSTKDLIYLVNKVRNVFLQDVNEEKISRSIAYKEVSKDQKVFSLKLTYDMDNEEINSIYKNMMNAISKDKTTLTTIARFMGFEEDNVELVQKQLEALANQHVEIQKIHLEFYRTLAGNDTVACDVDSDTYNISVGSLNDIYFATITKTVEKDGVIPFTIDFEYDTFNKRLIGTVKYKNSKGEEDTYEFDISQAKINNTRTEIKATFKYNIPSKTKEVYAVDFKLDIDTNKNYEMPDTKNAVSFEMMPAQMQLAVGQGIQKFLGLVKQLTDALNI